MRIGFSVFIKDGCPELQRFGTDQPRRRSLVTCFQTAGDCAVLLGSLYYCEDRQAQDSATSPSADSANDAALALQVFHHAGLRGLEHLEGDFSLVIWDSHRRRLIGLRDPLGGYPLFWTRQVEGIALSTSIHPLLEGLPSRAPDLEYVAEYLVSPGPANEVPSDRTAYQGIHRVRPGTMVTADLGSTSLRSYRYWDWTAKIVKPETKCLKEIGERYAALLRRAVHKRIRGGTASHLSGGMDSTAVSLIAEALTASRPDTYPPLHTLSLVYEKLPGLAGERGYQENVLQQHTGIRAHQIPADDALDFDSFADPPFHDEPFASLCRLGMDFLLVHKAAGLGVDTMLTGIGADEVLDMQPFYLADLLREGRWLSAWREATLWAAAQNDNPWEILYAFGLSIAFATPAARVRSIFSRAGPDFTGLSDASRRTTPPWIQKDFVRRYALEERSIDQFKRTFYSGPSTTLSVALSSIQARAGDVDRWYLAAPLGLTISHPFLDTHLLRFSLGILDTLRAQPGRRKPVLAEAMRGTLPDMVRNRRRKSAFNEVYYLGLSRNAHRLEALVHQAPIDELRIFDKPALTSWIQRGALGGIGARASHDLNLALAFIRWFSMQEERFYYRDQPTQVWSTQACRKEGRGNGH